MTFTYHRRREVPLDRLQVRKALYEYVRNNHLGGLSHGECLDTVWVADDQMLDDGLLLMFSLEVNPPVNTEEAAATTEGSD